MLVDRAEVHEGVRITTQERPGLRRRDENGVLNVVMVGIDMVVEDLLPRPGERVIDPTPDGIAEGESGQDIDTRTVPGTGHQPGRGRFDHEPEKPEVERRFEVIEISNGGRGVRPISLEIGVRVGLRFAVGRKRGERVLDLDVHRHGGNCRAGRAEIDESAGSDVELEVRVSPRIEDRVLGPVEIVLAERDLDDAVDGRRGRSEVPVMAGRDVPMERLIGRHSLTGDVIDDSFAPACPEKDALDVTINTVRIDRPRPGRCQEGMERDPHHRPACPVKREVGRETVDGIVRQCAGLDDCPCFGWIKHYVTFCPFLSFRG